MQFLAVIWLMIIVLLLLMRWRKVSTTAEVYVRTRSWFWMVLVVGVSFCLGYFVTWLLWWVLVARALWEIFRAFKLQPQRLPFCTWLNLGVVVCLLFCLGYFLGWLSSSPALNNAASAPRLSHLVFILFCVQVNDVSQFIMGRLFGRHALCSISPKKTVEGALGGMLLTLCFSMPLILCLKPFPLPTGLLVCAVACGLGILGDLHISWLKRQFHIKDLGTMIRGHGGVLDRIDSLLWAVPCYAIWLSIFLA